MKNITDVLHIINQKIDSGKILNVKKFKVRINDNVQSCLEKLIN